jgi:hypothetical protein
VRADRRCGGDHHTLSAGDVGHTIRVKETASNAGGAAGPSASAQTAVVTAPGGAGTQPTATPKLAFAGKVSVVAKGVRFTVTCTGARCIGRAKLTVQRKGKRVVIGSATFAIPAGGRKTVTVRINATGRRLLGRARHLRTTLTVTHSGSRAALSRHLTVRRHS